MEHNTTAPAAYSTKSAPVRSSRTACGPKSHYGPLYSLSAALEIEFWRKFGNRSPGHFVDSFYILVVQVDDWFDCLRLRNFPPRQAYLYARVCVCHLAVFCQHMILRRRPVLLILRRRPVLEANPAGRVTRRWTPHFGSVRVGFTKILHRVAGVSSFARACDFRRRSRGDASFVASVAGLTTAAILVAARASLTGAAAGNVC